MSFKQSARRVFVLAASVAGLAASNASAAVNFEFIDVGVPTDGITSMTGWRGVIVRVVSDEGPITRLDFSSPFGGIWGGIAQRWEDPTGQSDYTGPNSIRSPGPLTARNLTPSVFNFDTHYLGESASFQQFATSEDQDFFFTDRTGLPSTPTVGYGAALPYAPSPISSPLFLGPPGLVLGDVVFAPGAQPTFYDLAYVVTDSGFGVAGGVFTTSSQGGLSNMTLYYVPEPSTTLLAAITGSTLALLRRRGRVQTVPGATGQYSAPCLTGRLGVTGPA